MVDLFSGAAYGFTAVALAHPLDTIKTRQQAHATYLFCSAPETARLVVQREVPSRHAHLQSRQPMLQF